MNRIGDNLTCFGSNESIVRAFNKYSIEFILIGGLAVAWYCNDREADDMDLLVNPTMENSERISKALSDLNLSGFSSDSFAKHGLQVQLKQMYYADILTPRDDGPSYSTLAEFAVEAKLFNIPVLVASKLSLIQLKELAVASDSITMSKHLLDIERLRQVTAC